MRLFLQIQDNPIEQPRFYQLMLQQDLLGGWTLIRQWGKQGQRGSHRRFHYQSLEEAQEALLDARERLINKGYRVTFMQGLNQ